MSKKHNLIITRLFLRRKIWNSSMSWWNIMFGTVRSPAYKALRYFDSQGYTSLWLSSWLNEEHLSFL